MRLDEASGISLVSVEAGRNFPNELWYVVVGGMVYEVAAFLLNGRSFIFHFHIGTRGVVPNLVRVLDSWSTPVPHHGEVDQSRGRIYR